MARHTGGATWLNLLGCVGEDSDCKGQFVNAFEKSKKKKKIKIKKRWPCSARWLLSPPANFYTSVILSDKTSMAEKKADHWVHDSKGTC